jgi:hypothetical protein
LLLKIIKNFIKKEIKNMENTINETNTKEYLKVSEIAEKLNVSARVINKIFEELGWAVKKERWWLSTDKGLQKGAKEFYNPKNKQKYLKWHKDIINDAELIEAIKKRENKKVENVEKKTNKMTMKQKKEKGDKYETFIANFFKEQGYFVWEHGKEKGVEDSSIDLFVKKGKLVYFVQCKNWENWKINHKEVKATRTDVRDYLEKNKEFWSMIKDYEMKILYVTPKKCLTKSAYKYIEENSDTVEYKVIPMT